MIVIAWIIFGILSLNIGMVAGWCLRHKLGADPYLLHAAEEALEALTRNHNDEVQGDWNLADGYGLDDEVLWLTQAIAIAKGEA